MESHESRDFNVRKVHWTGLGLICLLAVIGVSALLRQEILVKDFHLVEVAPKTFPRQQAQFESGDLQQNLYRKQSEKLQTFGWVGPDQKWAQVSFERAARLVVLRKSTDPKILYQNKDQGARK